MVTSAPVDFQRCGRLNRPGLPGRPIFGRLARGFFTPHDIEATKAAGAVSVGVASGHYSTGELIAAGGDHVLGSLEDQFPVFDRTLPRNQS
jgi:hypothetical protein